MSGRAIERVQEMAAKCKYCKGTGERMNYWDDQVGVCGFCDGSGVRKPTEAAQAAALLRADLKKAFPGVKFSIKSRNFSMGDAVDVDWEDGPTLAQVQPFLWKYQGGHFDGMQDMYIDGPKVDHPTAKYVQAQRSMSKAVAEEMAAMVNQKWGCTLEIQQSKNYPEHWVYEGETYVNGTWSSQLMYREFADQAF